MQVTGSKLSKLNGLRERPSQEHVNLVEIRGESLRLFVKFCGTVSYIPAGGFEQRALMCRQIIALTILLFWSSLSIAKDTRPAIAYAIGTGTLSCGKLVSAERNHDEPQQELFVQWVWGFLVAYNMRSNFGKEWHRVSAISPPDYDSVLLYLGKYCAKYPLDSVMDATMSMIRDLGGRSIWKKGRSMHSP